MENTTLNPILDKVISGAEALMERPLTELELSLVSYAITMTEILNGGY
jgi:hypothetical protein